jgi:hypothetical protein
MEMERNNVHRGVAALAVVTFLALAGAPPAAATSLSFVDRLGSFWSLLAGEPGAAPAGRRAAASHAGTRPRQAKTAQTTTDSTDKGWGLDPNGNSFLSPLDPTSLH